MSIPPTLLDIRNKVRRITGRPSAAQITDAEIDDYINTFYRFDLPEHLRLENLKVNYEFNTRPNIAVYDFPTNSYLTNNPPVYIAGYQSYLTQSRSNFFRINPELNFLQTSIGTGSGIINPTVTNLTSTPIVPGFKPNPPGAYSDASIPANDIAAADLQWNVMINASGPADPTSGIPTEVVVVDDGQGNLFAPFDTSVAPASNRGTINYLTGAVTLTNFVDVNGAPVPTGNPINAQYIPYVASRPQSIMFFNDQFIVWPIPDQAYTVSIEAYKYPSQLLADSDQPQLQEWWQLLAYGASQKIFADNGDLDSIQQIRPLLDEQMRLILRRTIVQQTSNRTATIYTEQLNGAGQFPFGNLFSGF